MKRKKVLGILLVTGLLALGLTGCSNERQERQNAYKEAGIEALEQGDYTTAIEQFQNALDEARGEVDADEIDICYYKAIAEYANGEIDAAIETYNHLLDYDEELADVYYLRGNIYLDQGQSEQAIQDYETALTKKEDDLNLYLGIFQNLSAAGDTESATGFLKKATELSGSSASKATIRGRAYTLLGDYENAEKELQKAMDKGSSKAILYMGMLYQEEGNTDQAKTLFESYLTEHEEDAQAYNELGVIEMENGNYSDALSHFQKALEVAAENGESKEEILKNEILAYEYCGAFSQAKAAMDEYAANYPMDEAFQKEYTFLQTR